MWESADLGLKILAAFVPLLVGMIHRMARDQRKILRYTRALARRFAADEVTGPVELEMPIPPRTRGGTRAPRKPAPAFGVTVIRRAGTSGGTDDDE